MSSITFLDHEGRELPNHNGSAITLDDGNTLFFLHNGKGIVHDGSPFELPDGRMQYFDENGFAFWPIDSKKLPSQYTAQRDALFENRIEYINKQTPLDSNHVEELRLALLAAEHPDYLEQSINTANIQAGKKIDLKPLSEETKTYLILLKGIWCTLWENFQRRYKEVLSARYALEKCKINCSIAKSSLAETVLCEELKNEFISMDKYINPSKMINEAQGCHTTKDGHFILDNIFMEYCKKNMPGHGTEQFINQYKEEFSSKDFNVEVRIQMWRHPLYMHRCVAIILWINKIRRRVELLQKKPPALTYIVNEQVHRPMRNGTKYNTDSGTIIDRRGNELAIIDMNETSKTLPSMNIDVIQKILRPENIKVLSTVNAHRLLRWEIQTVTKQFVEGLVDARALKVYGGYQELANLLGAGNSRKTAEQLRDIIVWQAAPRFYQPNGRYGNMLSFDYTPSGKGRPAVLQLVLGNMMLPHYVYELLNMPQAYVSDRRLIPIVNMPPLIGRPNEQGTQPSYQIEILVEMRKAAREFATNGCVHITRTRLEELAEKAGLNRRLYSKVIDRWLQDGTDAPAFLKTVSEDHYALGSHYKQAQEFIIQAGKRELAMSKAGQRSVSRKNSGAFKGK